MRALVALGKRVYLLLPAPSGSDLDPKGMFQGSRFDTIKPLDPLPVFRRDEFEMENARTRSRLLEIAGRAGASVIDPIPLLCNSATCPVVSADGQPLYTDGIHMRPRYVREAAIYIDDAIARR